MYTHLQVKVEPITVSKCVYVCMYVRNRFLLLIMSSSVVVCVIDDKKCCIFITHFSSFEITYR